ncbi:fluoride efflux transporter CrcB [Flavobacterium pallidum]|uniref:Fluoride-specific ion channel FluC n=1 Tax=Flavobacterium pallidum TaxID=2172098 RepID=A0A2S1SH26_9FLAO|nr:fluoride efflux transporter CrcB [Flavobacterium pallidum]AWI25714.1 fluoride efflux transporter CrcB [Flavobacterium pallidum]
MKIIFAIGFGSFIGGILRYLLSGMIQAKAAGAFPYGTLSVNITGCLLIGIVYGFADKGGMTTDWRLFLATGILGGFTTFSAFSYETFDLLRNGQAFSALSYVATSIFIGVLATFCGFIAVSKYIAN